MLCRMEMVELKKGFDGATDFPYSPAQLAAALTQMINKAFDQEENQEPSKENQEPAEGSEERIDLFLKENKQEETLTEAQEHGYMGDCGGSQSVFVNANVPKSQPTLCKRKRSETGE